MILMQCVKAGGDRQILHEAIRKHSQDASYQVKNEGKPNDLIERIKNDSLFSCIHDRLNDLLEPKLFIGRAKEQTEEYIEEYIDPILKKYKSLLTKNKNYLFEDC
jgi:adenylosuccinate lyase